MHFAEPHILWILAIWPIMGWLCVHTGIWRKKMLLSLGDKAPLERLYPESSRFWHRRRRMMALIAMVFLTVAAARPQYGQLEQTVRAVGVNVIVAVDCSASMSAMDMIPSGTGTPKSRLDVAKDCLGLLIQRLAGHRLGVVAFAGAAVLQCPMTLDQGMAKLALDAIEVDSIGAPGTNLGAAINTAVEAFERGAENGGRALVLLTDGEDHEGKVDTAVGNAKEKGVVIYAIGIGNERGAPIPMAEGGFKEDETGSKVNTQLQMNALQNLSKETNGTALELTFTPSTTQSTEYATKSPMQAVQEITAFIDKQQRGDLESNRRVLYREQFQWFLAPAILLLLCIILDTPAISDIKDQPT